MSGSSVYRNPPERGVNSAYVHYGEVKAAHDPETAPATVRLPGRLVVAV